MVDFLSAMSDV